MESVESSCICIKDVKDGTFQRRPEAVDSVSIGVRRYHVFLC